jgi:hypothetical protein
LTQAPAQAAAVYSFQTFDNPQDPTFNQLLGNDNAGTIAGYFGVGSSTHPNKGNTFVPPASYTNENFPSSVQTQVVGINNNVSPTTVGFWIDTAGNTFGFVDQSNTFTSVSDPNVPVTGAVVTQLLGVNDSNLAAGFYIDAGGNAQGFLYNIATKAFTPITLPVAFNAAMTTVTDVSDSGVISGFYVDGGGNTHGFIDNGGTFTSFDDPNANGNTMFLGLNNAGMVVGSFVDGNGLTNGLVYNLLSNTWQTADDPNASATPAFDVTGTTINGINDKGQLVGFFSDGTNVNGFLATPTPEPASLGFVALGTVFAIALSRRKKTVHRTEL